MIQLASREPNRTLQLVQKIIEKASGVFLWVVLVVKSLLDGLMNHDTILDLEKRLDLLPPDLEDLYRHMINRIDALYRPRASRFFQIVSRMEEPPLALVLSLADEEDPDCPIISKIERMSFDEEVRRIHEIEVRIRSVCVGFLELHEVKESRHFNESTVHFMHRTVVDFFERPDVREMLSGFTTGTVFHPDLAILGVCILQLKWLVSRPNSAQDCHKLWNVIQQALSTASRADADGVGLDLRLLDEFDRVATYHWSPIAEENPKLTPETAHWTNWVPSEYCSGNASLVNSFISHAVRYQFSSYLREKLSQAPQKLIYKGRPLLDVAIPPPSLVWGFQEPPAPQLPSLPTIEILLESGEDPNLSYLDQTPWQNALSQVCIVFMSTSSAWYADSTEARLLVKVWISIFDLLLYHGADPDARVSVSLEFGTVTKSALAVVSDVLHVRDPGGAEKLQHTLGRRGAAYHSHTSSSVQDAFIGERSRSAARHRSGAQATLRVPYRLRSIVPKAGVRTNLYQAAHQAQEQRIP